MQQKIVKWEKIWAYIENLVVYLPTRCLLAIREIHECQHYRSCTALFSRLRTILRTHICSAMPRASHHEHNIALRCFFSCQCFVKSNFAQLAHTKVDIRPACFQMNSCFNVTYEVIRKACYISCSYIWRTNTWPLFLFIKDTVNSSHSVNISHKILTSLRIRSCPDLDTNVMTLGLVPFLWKYFN